jgi:hypothetical protein
MLDILGVRGDISIIWNAIPFTFIVDWFVGVQNFLESFAVDNLQFRVKILDFCSSVKISSEARVSCWHYDDQSGANQIHHPKQLIMEGRAKYYERRVTLPNIHQALNLSGLSGREAFLSAALIGANTKRK